MADCETLCNLARDVQDVLEAPTIGRHERIAVRPASAAPTYIDTPTEYVEIVLDAHTPQEHVHVGKGGPDEFRKELDLCLEKTK